MEPVAVAVSVPSILALVELAKKFGVQGRWSALLAVVLGIGLSLAQFQFAPGADPSVQGGYYSAVMFGLGLGLSAAGVYDVATLTGLKREPAAVVVANHADVPMKVEVSDPDAAAAAKEVVDGGNVWAEVPRD